MDIDLSEPRRLHVVGVGGTGMNAVAAVLIGMGHHVTGSDIKESAAVQRVRALGAEVRIGHDPSAVRGVDAVVTSTAVPASNPEIRAAREAGIAVLHRSKILGALARMHQSVAVAGTHGKTTTSSMLTLALRAAGRRPSFVIGGDVNEIGTGAGWGDGELFVVEADESDGTFLELGAGAVIVTSLEPDHLEYYGSDPLAADAALHDAFARFLAGSSGPRVVCVDQPAVAALAAEVPCTTYGTAEGADYRICDVVEARSSIDFSIRCPDGTTESIALPLPGLHNAANATAAFAMCGELGVPREPVVEALGRFGGVARRYEFRGSIGGITFVDDYAHIPGELTAVLSTAAAGGYRRVVATFQPHRYSRTATLWSSFADAFVDADVVVLTDVYAAGEAPRPGVSGELLVHAVLDAHPRTRVVYLPRRDALVGFLTSELRSGDVCMTLGAGDVTTVGDEVMSVLAGVRDRNGAAGENGAVPVRPGDSS
ncbi:MAG: UDP-N-acetylmuramate--L-alanine ligase [Actinobacteria bacterium]|nr:UDP-N-acetylmuramate--L-alanine ligase [Actinomycetota bacterium]